MSELASPTAVPDLLDTLFAPQSVAVVGASDNMAKMSAKIVHMLQKFGFAGQIAPVNPTRPTLFGLPCYPSVAAIPYPVDLAFLYLPRAAMDAAIDECIAARVRNLVILAGGYAEVGAAGAAEQAALTARLRAAGVGLLGPNCAGLACFHDRFVTYATSSLVQLPAVKAGEVSIISQSGGVGNVVFNLLQDRQIGLARMVSTGNEAVIGAHDCLRVFASDAHSRTILLFIESYRALGSLTAAIRAAVEGGRNVGILRAGRTAPGGRAAASHSAALAGDARIFDGALRQAGAALCKDMDELVDYALFTRRRAPLAGRRLGIYTVLGGGASITTDLALEHGLEVPPLAEDTVTALRGVLAANSAFGNPIDPTGDIHIARSTFPDSVGLVAADTATDGYVVLPAVGDVKRSLELTEDLIALAERHPKPLAVIWPGDANLREAWSRLDAADIPLYFSSRAAIAAMAMAAGAEAARARLASSAAREVFTPTAEQEDALAAALRATPRGTLTEHSSKQLLATFRLAVTRETEVETPAAARAAATALGLPVALKASSPDLPHKSDGGYVLLGLADGAAVEEQAGDMLARMRAAGCAQPRLLVAEMLPRSAELIIGARRGPDGSMAIVLGVGGIGVELIDDSATALAPLSRADALDLTWRLRSQQLFAGWRGLPAIPRDGLAEVLMRFSVLARRLAPHAREIDINPLMVRADTLVAADALVVLAPRDGTTEPDQTIT